VRIWTSYFASAALRERTDLVRVAITRWPPRWRGAYDEDLKCLAPNEAIFHVGPERFATLYRAQLDGLGIGRVGAQLRAISRRHGGADLVLLCFEAKPQDCHRGMFRTWWEANGGPRIEELPRATSRAKRPRHQLALPLGVKEGAYKT